MSTPARTLTWEQVCEFYADFMDNHAWDIAPLLALARHRAAEPYGSALFPYTSHDILRIGRAPHFEMQVNELSIQYVPRQRAFQFTYSETPGLASSWTTSCDAGSWKNALTRVLHKHLRWFQAAGRSEEPCEQ